MEDKMSKPIRISKQTRANWLIDAAVFIGGVLAAITGIYFLFLPSGGYQGGRNPAYGIKILFDRHTWSDLHTWTGLVMVAAALIHLAIHWRWVLMMIRRGFKSVRGQGVRFSTGARVNVAVDLVLTLSFLLCGVTGVLFFFNPDAVHNRAWDLIHTWSGNAMIVAAVLHFWIHWLWVTKVTRRFFLSLLPGYGSASETAMPAFRSSGRTA
jgi:hypothetical protein